MDLGMSIRLRGSVVIFELRETGDWDIFLGPPERARAETGGADQYVLKQREFSRFAIVNVKTRPRPWDTHYQFSIEILLSKTIGVPLLSLTLVRLSIMHLILSRCLSCASLENWFPSSWSFDTSLERWGQKAEKRMLSHSHGSNLCVWHLSPEVPCHRMLLLRVFLTPHSRRTRDYMTKNELCSFGSIQSLNQMLCGSIQSLNQMLCRGISVLASHSELDSQILKTNWSNFQREFN